MKKNKKMEKIIKKIVFITFLIYCNKKVKDDGYHEKN